MYNRNNLFRCALATFAAAYFFSFAASAAAKEVVIALRVIHGVEKSLKQWQPTIDYLNQRIDGHTFKLAPFVELSKLSAAAKRGEFDYVITNPSSYVDMEINVGASRMLTLINKRQGKPYTEFGSVIYTRAGRTDILTLEDLKGKTLMAVSKRSFGGWRVAWGELLKHGVDPFEDLKEVMFNGKFQKDVVYAVRDGKADAGVARTDMLERMAESGNIELNDFRILGPQKSESFPFLRSTDLYPEWPFAKLPKATNDLSRKIVHELLQMPANSRAALHGKYIGWSVPMNYQPVHSLLKLLKVGPYKDYGKVTFSDTLRAYRYWIAAIIAILIALSTTGYFALTRSRQLARLRSEMLIKKDIELGLSQEHSRILSHAIEQSPSIVFITDVEGNIDYVNPKFVKTCGYTAEEAFGKKPSILQSGETPPEIYAELWRTIKSGLEWRGELKDRSKDGSMFWASVVISPVADENGEITHFVSVHEDITQRKNMELREREARIQAEISSRAKTDLMANMSHELRTPLNAIIGFSGTMKGEVFGPIGNEKYREYMDDIHYAGQHLLDLINDILDASAIEAGAVELNEDTIRISDVIDASIRIINPRAAEARVKITSSLNSQSPRIFVDERRTKQIFLNLLSNAVKFTPEGGEVSIMSQLNDNGSYAITIADTGIGMDESEIEIAMSKFGQVDSGLDRKHEGTGLGLPLTVGLMESHGGTLEVKSTKGRGTQVTAIFPKERVAL